MDQAHPNAASIKGILDDAAGNSRSQRSTHQHGGAEGQAAAGALDARACPEVRGARRCRNSTCWAPSCRSCTDLRHAQKFHRFSGSWLAGLPHWTHKSCCVQADAGGSGEGLGKDEGTCDLTRPEYSTGEEGCAAAAPGSAVCALSSAQMGCSHPVGALGPTAMHRLQQQWGREGSSPGASDTFGSVRSQLAVAPGELFSFACKQDDPGVACAAT